MSEPTTDPRVRVQAYTIYPADYDLIPYSDRFNWVLEVVDGHAWGWSIRQAGFSGSRAMNRKGEWVHESRGSGRNKPRRWSLDDALSIALEYVDDHKVNGMSAREAVANREAILLSFEERRA